MSEVIERPKEGKLVTMEFQDAYARTGKIQEIVARMKDVAIASGHEEDCDDYQSALTELQNLLSELTFNP